MPVTVTSTDSPSAQDLVFQLIQSALGILGLIGVNIPPIFLNLRVEQETASFVLLGVSLAWAAYQRLVTKPKEMHATAMASAAARAPRRAII